MSVEPAPAIDWAVEHRRARQRIDELVAGGSAADGSRVVEVCPEWTVHDVVAHVVSLASALSAGDLPRGDIQEWIDGLVEDRRSTPFLSLTDEWDERSDAIDAFVAGMGTGGATLVYDAVAHEHDLRLALGRPGARDSSGVAACAAAASQLLAGDLGRLGLPAVRITSAGRTWDVGAGEPQLEIELDPFELIRVFGSRRSERQLRALPWRGDLDRYLPAICHLPLPDHDIDE